jgi:hypothetical protein
MSHRSGVFCNSDELGHSLTRSPENESDSRVGPLGSLGLIAL